MRWQYLAFALTLPLVVNGATAQVIISEVMANPKGIESGAGSPGDRNEYVELYNRDSLEIDVEGWILWDGDAYDVIEAWTDTSISDPDVIIDTTVICSGCYAVILDPEYTDVGDTTFMEPYDFPPGTVIMKVGNTTIGDGLSGEDPLSLGTPDTTFLDTYGTPSDTTDSIPFDAGDGISIERIDLDKPDCEENWAPCQDSMGTPGGKNSVTGLLEQSVIQDGGVGSGLRAHPNPFHGAVIFSVSKVTGSTVSIQVYDVAGMQIKDFGDIKLRGSITWDGIGDDGKPMPAGLYFGVLESGRGRAMVKIVKLK